MVQLRTAMLPILVILLMCPSAFGQDAGVKEWEFQLAPYFWVPAVDADTTVSGVTTSIDLSFGDIVDNFDVFGLSGRFEAWWMRKVGFTFDGMYIDLETSQQTPVGGNLNVNITQAILDFGLGYRLGELKLEKARNLPTLWFDLLGGLRYTYLDQTLTFQPGPELGGNEDWLEPFIGGRIGLRIIEKLTLLLRGDVSGFGLANASDLTWNFLVGLDYRPWELASIRLAYRAFGLDYETGTGRDKFGFDGTLNGPQLGVIFYF